MNILLRALSPLIKKILKDDRREYYLFRLRRPVNELQSRLSKYGWQPNPKGYVYEGQIGQWRRIINNGRNEHHIRLYSDGVITGHFSLTPERGFLRHLFAIGSRSMTEKEVNQLISELNLSGGEADVISITRGESCRKRILSRKK